MTDSFNIELHEALRLSALEASKGARFVIGTSQTIFRKDLTRSDKHAPMHAKAGHITQLDTLNQFHPHYLDLSTSFHGPTATCGYFACAYALMIEENLALSTIEKFNLSSIQEICDRLCDETIVDQRLRQVFTQIQDNRRIFYSDIRFTSSEREKALRAWVANYEIGDFLKQHCKSSRTAFLRFNQWPYRGEATADERPRLDEESRFGGILNSGNDSITYSEGDSVYFVENYDSSKSIFYSPTEWAQKIAEESPQECLKPRVVVVDLMGHFATALICQIQTSDTVSVPAMILFNTMESNYLSNLAIPWVFDSMHGDGAEPTDSEETSATILFQGAHELFDGLQFSLSPLESEIRPAHNTSQPTAATSSGKITKSNGHITEGGLEGLEASRIRQDEAEMLASIVDFLPETVMHSSHAHRLIKTHSVYNGRGFECDICNAQGFLWSYHCDDCGFDAHPKCVCGYGIGF